MQSLHFCCWLLSLLLHSCLKWVKRIRFPYTYLHLVALRQFFGVTFVIYTLSGDVICPVVLAWFCQITHRSWADFFVCRLTTNPGESGYIFKGFCWIFATFVFFWESFCTTKCDCIQSRQKTEKVRARLFKLRWQIFTTWWVTIGISRRAPVFGRGHFAIKNAVLSNGPTIINSRVQLFCITATSR